MPKPTSILRAIGKIIFWLATTIVLVIAIWYVANRSLDEAPDPNRIAYLAAPDDQVPDAQNIAVGLVGFAAPSGVDPIAYGAKIKALPHTESRSAQIHDMQYGPNSLRLSVASEKIRCWTDNYPGKEKACLPLDQVPAVLAQNKELLERYRGLYRLDKYADTDVEDDHAFIDVVKLSVADMRLDLRQHDYESAYRKCRDQLVFVRKILRATDSRVGLAVGLVAFGDTLPVLEDLITASPDIANLHTTELMEVLYPVSMDMFNPEGMARAEYRSQEQTFQPAAIQGMDLKSDWAYWLTLNLSQKNKTLNRLYAAYQQYGTALRLPWKQANAELDRIGSSYDHLSTWDYLIDPLGSMLVQYKVQKRVSNRVMDEQMVLDIGRLRQIVLQVRIIHENISDDDIPKFLAAADPSLYGPFAGTPMHWNAKARKIYLDDPRTANACLFPYARIPVRGAGVLPDNSNC